MDTRIHSKQATPNTKEPSKERREGGGGLTSPKVVVHA